MNKYYYEGKTKEQAEELALEELKKTLQDNNKKCDNIIVAEQKERTELVEV